MKRIGYFLLVGLLAPIAGFSPSRVAPEEAGVRPTPPVTDRAIGDAAHALDAKIRKVLSDAGGVTAIADRLKAKAAALREHLQPKTAYGRMKTYLVSFTERGRKLQTADAYLSDLASIAEQTFGASATITSFADMWPRVTAVTCSGPLPNDAFVSAMLAGVDPDGNIGLAPIANQALTCLCAASWSFSDPAYATLYSEIIQLVRLIEQGSPPDASSVDPLLFALRDALPLLSGPAGYCSATCQSATKQLLRLLLDLAESNIEGLVYPPTAKADAPTSFVACNCGGGVGIPYNDTEAILGFFGASPYTTVANVFSSSTPIDSPSNAAFDVLVQAGANAFDHMMKRMLCGTHCKAAFVKCAIASQRSNPSCPLLIYLP